MKRKCKYSTWDAEQKTRQGEADYIERMSYWGLGIICVVFGLVFFVVGLEGKTAAPLAWLKGLFD